MGREIRRVPPNWQHPTKQYQWGVDHVSMLDKTFTQACAEWDAEKAKWDAGERPEYCKGDDGPYEDYAGERPDDPEMYRPWEDAEATWYQLWQTVSEGSPVSPPFATLGELARYLGDNGDFWDQKRGDPPWGLARAQAFCREGWAPSFVMIGGQLIPGTALAEIEGKKS